MKKSIIALILVLVSQVTTAETFDAKAFTSCMDRWNAVKFDPIRSIFPGGGDKVSNTMLNANTFPSPIQQHILQDYYNTIIKCENALVSGIPAQGTGIRLQNTLLHLLTDKHITFADFALWRRNMEEITSNIIELRTKVLTLELENERLQKSRDPILTGTLVCQFSITGIDTRFEEVITFNQSTNVVSSSRGNISKYWITNTEIGIVKDISTTTISRLTGSLLMVFPSGGAANGQCTPAQSQKF